MVTQVHEPTTTELSRIDIVRLGDRTPLDWGDGVRLDMSCKLELGTSLDFSLYVQLFLPNVCKEVVRWDAPPRLSVDVPCGAVPLDHAA